MNLENIYQFFQNPPPIFLSQELAACYVMSVLLQRDSYGTELINYLETEYPSYQLSDTILQNTLKLLESEQVISSYWKRVEKRGRGRPRRMYHLCPQWSEQAGELARFWQEYSLSYSRSCKVVQKIKPRFNHHNLQLSR